MKMHTFLLSCLIACLAFAGCSKEQHQATPQQYTIEQFLSTKSYAGGTFTYDENRILFSSDESGFFNVYSIPLNGGKQTQLTNSKGHAIFVISGFPADDRFLYTSDEHGNELHHIYMREGDGTVRDLTPYEGARSEFHGWSRNQKSFFFESNVRDPKSMDLYEMDIETFTPTLVYKNENAYQFGPVSPDKRYLPLIKILSSNNTELYLCDLTTNAIKEITPHKNEIAYKPLFFSMDSKTLFFLTDENSDFAYLRKYSIDSGDFGTVEKYNWDIDSAYTSYNGKYRVTSINEDGKTVIKIFDLQSGKPVKLPELPDGEITDVIISKSEKSMIFYVNGSRSPNNLYVYNFAKGTYKKLTNSLGAEINPNDLVEAEVIRYPSFDDLMIPSIFYKPKNIKDGMKVPALVWVHGGPGGQSRIGYNYLIQYLVNHGYAVLAVNNRGSSGYGKSFYQAADLKHGDVDLADCLAAKKYLSDTGFVDETKIGIIGGSYGGYITLAALAFHPDEMALGVDIFGVSNWVRTLKSIPAWWESEREALYKKIGNPETDAEYLESISPLFHAKNITKPLLVLQGANDPRVLKVESDQIIEAVSSNGIAYRYIVFDDEGHGFAKKQNRLEAGKAILEFLNENLK